jgi:hypothetical protein
MASINFGRITQNIDLDSLDPTQNVVSGIITATLGSSSEALQVTTPVIWDQINDTYYEPSSDANRRFLQYVGAGPENAGVNYTVAPDLRPTSFLRRCLLQDNGVVLYYLDADDSTKIAGSWNGTTQSGWLRIYEGQRKCGNGGDPVKHAGTGNSYIRQGLLDWSSATTYFVGDRVIHSGSVWESLANNNLNVTPAAGTAEANLAGNAGQVMVEIREFFFRHDFYDGRNWRNTRGASVANDYALAGGQVVSPYILGNTREMHCWWAVTPGVYNSLSATEQGKWIRHPAFWRDTDPAAERTLKRDPETMALYSVVEDVVIPGNPYVIERSVMRYSITAANATTDTLTTTRDLRNGISGRFSGTAIGDLNANTTYWVRDWNPATRTFKLATSSALTDTVDLTSATFTDAVLTANIRYRYFAAYQVTNDAIAYPITAVDTATGIFTTTATLKNGLQGFVSGTSVGNLSATTNYFVRDWTPSAGGGTFRLAATSNGSAVSLSGTFADNVFTANFLSSSSGADYPITDVSGSTITIGASALSPQNGQQVFVSGTSVGNLSTSTPYFVRDWNAATRTLSIATSVGGAAITPGALNSARLTFRRFPLVNIRVGASRLRARNRGNYSAGLYADGWAMADYTLWTALQTLYLSEYRNFASRSSTVGVGRGRAELQGTSGSNNSGLSNTNGNSSGVGPTDPQPQSTSQSLDYATWRGIENFWGGVWKWLDGININSSNSLPAHHAAWISLNPSTFVDNTSTDYSLIGYINGIFDGRSTPSHRATYQKDLLFTTNNAFFPKSGNSSSGAYITSGCWLSRSGGWRSLMVANRFEVLGSPWSFFCDIDQGIALLDLAPTLAR